MGFYETYILPEITDLVCSAKPIRYQRRKVVPLAKGRILEIGIGSGLNLSFYDASRVERVWGMDPSARMLKMAEKRAQSTPFEVELIGLSGESIPMESNVVDSVLVTYTLCTIPNVLQALDEMRRVLKPEGELIFCEHGLAPDESVRRWQARVNPIWNGIGGGCNLNRDIPGLIVQAGFKLTQLESMYLPGWRPGSFNYWGAAVSR